MEIVALNERLRSDFTPLLKLLPLGALSGEKCSAPPSEGAPAPGLTRAETADSDQFVQHCRVMLWRLNSYQYGSLGAFRADLAQLVQFSSDESHRDSAKRLLERLEAVGNAWDAKKHTPVYTSDGATVVIEHSGVRGVQQATKATTTADNSDCPWQCNVALRDVTVTISSFASQEEALQGYEKQRAAMTTSPLAFAKLRQLGHSRDAAQREADVTVLREAKAQCHPRLTSLRVSAPPSSSTTSSLTATSTPSKAPKPAIKAAVAVAAYASPRPEPPAAPMSPPWAPGQLKTPESTRIGASRGQKRAKSPEQRSFLRLRRLIQKKLCRHLRGREVCVMVSPDRAQEQDESKWRASGRLEAGKVNSYARKKQISFADYVKDELGYTASACPHMFLVHTRESIDDHLKVCDTFTDEDREELGKNLSGSVKSFVQAKNRKRRR